MKHSIIVCLEQKEDILEPVGLEIISEVKRQTAHLKDVTLSAVYVGSYVSNETLRLVKKSGIKTLYTLLSDTLLDYDTHYYSKHLIRFLKDYPFDVFLIGSTLIGRDLAPRISATVHTGLTADATQLAFEISNEALSLLATRPALGGNLLATIVCPDKKPQMATVRPSVFAREDLKESDIKIINVLLKDLAPSKVQIIKRTLNPNISVELNKAKLIIAGGRGVQNQFEQLITLANLTHGEVAASRAVVDAKVTSKSRLVGQTGQTVRPSVYLAMGISGAIQHISGMDQSEMIIAVNTDSSAPIFDIASTSIVCDANQVIPLLIKALQHQEINHKTDQKILKEAFAV